MNAYYSDGGQNNTCKVSAKRPVTCERSGQKWQHLQMPARVCACIRDVYGPTTAVGKERHKIQRSAGGKGNYLWSQSALKTKHKSSNTGQKDVAGAGGGAKERE